MFIGNQTSCWATTPRDPFDFALAQNFDAFEWFPDKKDTAGWDDQDLDVSARQSIHAAASTRGIRLSVHARWQANPLSVDSALLFARDLELARDLGAVLFNIHFAHEKGVAAFVEAIEPLIRQTAEAGLQLAIENTPHHNPEQFNELFERLRNLASVQTAHVGMCLDIGHANLSSSTLNNYLGFYDRLGTHVPIRHVHLHENWGDSDSHLPVFTGPSAQNDAGIRGLVSRLKNRRFSGSIILEQWPQPPSLLVSARDRLRELWGPGELSRPSPAAVARVSSGDSVPAGQHSFVDKLVEANQRSRSWREKLEATFGLLEGTDAVSLDALVLVSIYLKFLGTGQIACVEDGRHFRPAHHAKLAEKIHHRLAQLRTPQNESVLRRIYPWLPSSSATFRQPEPLTRIRDIAHRNDIPSELKREIKTRLQNKLHRCAGPEDLATSAELLARFTAPQADYPPAFVDQFKIFHQELKEFFNARSLEEQLESLIASTGPAQQRLIQQFLREKHARDLAGELSLLQTLVQLRLSFAEYLSRPADSIGQEFILADIALEDFSFALLSQIINACQEQDPDSADRCRREALLSALANLGLSGVDVDESRAIESEVRAWSQDLPSSNPVVLLRLRATLLRCRRLTGQFGDRIIDLFAGKAETLGRALQLSENAVRVFSEAEIRRHVVFQVSKLVDALIQTNRERLQLPPWNVVVPGQATGRAIARKSLQEWKPSELHSLLLLEKADGDEEIPREVVALVLAHEMPHLAHLSVRARQAGVVFVTCEESAEFQRVRAFDGQAICLTALPDKVTFGAADPSPAWRSKVSPLPPRLPEVRLSSDSPCLPLETVSAEVAGAKALGARRLADLAHQSEAGFRVPRSMAIPFAALESALHADSAVAGEYRELVLGLNQMPATDFANAVDRLQKLVAGLSVPEAIAKEAVQRFAAGSRLVVRSSASGEDLEEFAGAGLYDSKINVRAKEVASAVREVWASLWSRRAAESRRAAQLSQDQAYMAVLIQELVEPEFSFVLHTVNPINSDAKQLYAEIVVGLGETLASAAAAGTPYRLAIDKRSGNVKVLAFANFSQAIRPAPESGLCRDTLDYSKIQLSREVAALERLGAQLARVGTFVEINLGGPQDIEGATAGGAIYLVQARPQQGLWLAGNT